jgi:ADP-heptose:LPS heptosyltransferase
MKNKKFIKSFLLKLFTKKSQSSFKVTSSKKVLILKYDRIGDMIVTTPILRELKKAYPDISISVLASNENKDVIKYNPYVESIYTNYKNNLLMDLSKLLLLRWKKFDVCIELDHSVIPHAIFRLKIINPKKIISIHKDGRYGVKGNELQLYDFLTKKESGKHFGEIWLSTLSFFDIKNPSNKFDIFLSDTEINRAQAFSKSIASEIKIGINLEGSYKEKQIQPADLQKICISIKENFPDITIVILSHPNKRENTKQLVIKMDLESVIMSYETKNILELAALINELDFIISPDTSIVHIASAFNKPILSIHENNQLSYSQWKPLSSISKTVFSQSKYGIIDYKVNEVIDLSLEIIKEIKEKI